VGTSPTQDIVTALQARQIRASPAVTLPGFAGVAIAISVVDLERFLDILIERPLVDDGLATRVIGRGQDLGPTDEPWRFELVTGIADAGFEFHAIANIPDDDIVEVLYRLADTNTAR
jgi:hypothetical protein